MTKKDTKYPKASNFDSIDSFFEHITNARENCNKRGYHRVDQEERDPLICYDCDLWFDKDSAIRSGIEYRVENP